MPKKFLMFVLCWSVAIAACGGDSTSIVMDSDSDGVLDADDAFPNDASESSDGDGAGGTQIRTRTVMVEPAFGGEECPPVAEESQSCNEQGCQCGTFGAESDCDLAPVRSWSENACVPALCQDILAPHCLSAHWHHFGSAIARY